MATTGTAEADRTKRGSTYSNEVATPGYYATTFDQFAVRAEATATERASVERYTISEEEYNKNKGVIKVKMAPGGGFVIRLTGDFVHHEKCEW